jgi:hypothetical protein
MQFSFLFTHSSLAWQMSPPLRIGGNTAFATYH